MPTYNIYPAVDENSNFPPVVRSAFANSNELGSAINTKLSTNTTVITAAKDAVAAESANLANGVIQEVDALQATADGSLDLKTNLAPDPKPLKAATNYFGARCNISTITGYGRALADGTGATYFYPYYKGSSGVNVHFPAPEGKVVSGRVEVKSEPTISMAAHVELKAYTWDGTGFTGLTTIDSDPLYVLGADGSKVFQVSAVMPVGKTHVSMWINFRRTGQSYPVAGDSVYFKNVALHVDDYAVDQEIPYLDGDSEGAFWLGTVGESQSRRSDIGPKLKDAALPTNRRAVIVDAGLRRRGRIIGTGGKAAVALRFDHHFNQFNAKVMPLLRKYRLPWGQFTNIGNFGSGNDTLTVDQVRDLCYTSGGELWNHSRTHSSVYNESDADREITGGLAELKAAFPGLYIDGWGGPGQPSYLGLEGSDTPAKFYGTYPGRLVLDQHAFVRGYYDGLHSDLVGHNLIGQVHTTIDAQTSSWVNSVMNGVINDRVGITLMLHPNYLDTTGYMTTADLEAVLANIAAKRDAGDLVVLTPTGILMADAERPRSSLIRHSGGTITTNTTITLSSRTFMSQLGVPQEASVTVKAKAAGTVSLRTVITHPGGTIDQIDSRTVVLGEAVELRVLTTPPIGTTNIAITISGNVDFSAVRFHAI